MATSIAREVAASWLAGENEYENLLPDRENHHGLLQSTTHPHDACSTRGGDDSSSYEPRNAGFKAHLAEVILQTAAQGVTSYDGFVAAASDQIQAIISMLT
jgi:hypothetical protein